jgi:hypothetical protein
MNEIARRKRFGDGKRRSRRKNAMAPMPGEEGNFLARRAEESFSRRLPRSPLLVELVLNYSYAIACCRFCNIRSGVAVVALRRDAGDGFGDDKLLSKDGVQKNSRRRRLPLVGSLRLVPEVRLR